MGMNITERVLSEHLVEGELKAGNEIGIKIDHTITQDATGTMVYLQFESMGIKKIKSELAVSYVDHNTVQVGPENADDHEYLQSAAARYGAVYSKPGNGICHQLHLERFGGPGKTMLGSDSHTPTGGGLGMIAIGAGGIDVAVAMGGGPFYMTAPKVIRIELQGKMKPWVSAKDVILQVLDEFTTKGNVGCVFEYGGPGVASLSVPERATIANMGAECGVTTSVFPSDETTKSFLEAQQRGDCWREIKADPDAQYSKTVEIDLSEIEPLAAKPHSPGNIATVNSLMGKKVHQVLIGSCTNSSYRDLKMVAKILEGQQVHKDVELGIAPGSRQVMLMLAKEKLLEVFLSAGARLLENACGFCIGNSMSPPSEGVSLRTSNRNFEGRSGTASAQVYLVSPETAALSAISGRVVDALTFVDQKYPSVREPKEFVIDDAMFIRPPKKASDVEIKRGPSIGIVPENEKLPTKLDGVATVKVGDMITTDHIMPAGKRLKYRSNVEEYAKYVFETTAPGFYEKASEHRDSGIHNVIVAGASYGQGSSREHAALCPMFLGVKAVIAKSIERIHLANLINFGIIPFTFSKAGDYDAIDEGDRLAIENLSVCLKSDEGKALLKNQTKGTEVSLDVKLNARQRKILFAGGMLNTVTRKKQPCGCTDHSCRSKTALTR